MIAYRVLRTLGRLALRWFYRDIEVVGEERLPHRGPVLLASNHPNALVDALVIGCTVRRPVTLTAKATLLDNPVTRMLLRSAGVVPLRRASDAARSGENGLDPARNADAFAAVLGRLEEGGVVLLFPEGKSHSDPSLAPLKTGLARIALMARDERRLRQVPIIPVGLTFERKWEPRSRVLVHIGSPVIADQHVPNNASAVSALTTQVDVALRDVTLNFRTPNEAHRVLTTSTILTEVLDKFRPLEAPDPPLIDNVRVAQRLNSLIPLLGTLEPKVEQRIEQFLARLSTLETELDALGVAATDVQMSTRVSEGIWFVVRELGIAVVAGPLAVWGRVNHWIPLRIARALALKTSRSPDEPATNTIVAGLILVLAFYLAQISLVAWFVGRIVAFLYAISLPVSATWDFRYADRLRRGFARVRIYLRFRRDPDLHQRLLNELSWLRTEAVALDTLLDATRPQLLAITSGG